MQCTVFTSPTIGWQSLIYRPPSLLDDGRVLLYLHGAGGFGTGIEGLLDYPDLPSLLREGLSLTSTVAIPSCPTSGHWQSGQLAAFLDDLEVQLGGLPASYDVLGFSRGGTGAMEFAAAYPHRVRSLATLAARVPHRLTASGGTFPALVVHGKSDDKVPVHDAHTLVAALVASGHPCELMLVDAGHYLVDAAVVQRVVQWQQLV
jgi:poly(3-hydroxybutyrate) depolymerase